MNKKKQKKNIRDGSMLGARCRAEQITPPLSSRPAPSGKTPLSPQQCSGATGKKKHPNSVWRPTTQIPKVFRTLSAQSRVRLTHIPARRSRDASLRERAHSPTGNAVWFRLPPCFPGRRAPTPPRWGAGRPSICSKRPRRSRTPARYIHHTLHEHQAILTPLALDPRHAR